MILSSSIKKSVFLLAAGAAAVLSASPASAQTYTRDTRTTETRAAYANNSYAPEGEGPVWTGPYIGAHIGGTHSDFNTATPNTGPSGGSASLNAGGQIGMNWQAQRFVYGLEGDWSWLDLDSNNGTAHFNEGWQSTVRGRFGYTMGGWLPYATGGLALTQTHSEIAGVGSDNDLRVGWALGGGVEKFVSDRISGRLEYLHTDVPQSSQTIGGAPFSGGSGNDTIRAALNYHF